MTTLPVTDIKRIAIIGAGTMGQQVSWACLANGIGVQLFDASEDALQRAEKTLLQWFSEDKANDHEKYLANLVIAGSLEEALLDVDLVFENIPEVLELKRNIHAEIDRLLPEHALQGTNASSLVCSKIASVTSRPDRFFNMNFSFPRAGDRLVEVMPNPQTSSSTLEVAEAWARKIGMIPITLKKENMGYVQNRIWRAIKKECLSLLAKGMTTADDIDRGYILNTGSEFGPCALMDLVGLQTVAKIEQAYYEESGDPTDRPPQFLLDMVEAGQTGVATNKGFYSYPNPAYEDPDWLTGGS